MKLSVTMALTKQTKNKTVYSGDEEDTAIPALYIENSAFKDKNPPEFITVVITEGQE